MNSRAIEIKADVTAQDVALSRAFHCDFGLTEDWAAGELACFSRDGTAFLRQDVQLAEHSANVPLHLLVDDVDAWWRSVADARPADRDLVRAEAPAARPWGMRDFVLLDPSGVLWRIGQAR